MNIVKFNELRNLPDEMNRLFSGGFPRFENREEAKARKIEIKSEPVEVKKAKA